MGQQLSMDLRRRLLAAIDGGNSCQVVAERLGVAPSTAIRSPAQRLAASSFAPKSQGSTQALIASRSAAMRAFRCGKRARTSPAKRSGLNLPAWACRLRPMTFFPAS